MRQSFCPKEFLILLVDDVTVNLKVLQGVLEPVGYNLTFATGGQQALERVRAAKPDLILLDLMMPEISGFQICEILKHEPQFEDIPIIFLTASHETEHLIQAFEHGAVDYITKPFKKPELLARVRTHLELKHLHDYLQKQIEQERILSRIIQGIRYSLSLEDILQTTASEVRHFLQADRVVICQHTQQQACQIVAVATQSNQDLVQPGQIAKLSWIDPSENAGGRFPQCPRIQRLDAQEAAIHSPSHLAFMEAWQVRTELTLPIFQRDTLWGALIAHHCRDLHAWLTDEVNVLSRLIEPLAIAIQQSELYQQLQIANQELQQLSTVDGLTQVANRRHFDQTLTQEWYKLQREQHPLSLILCDIDHFKQYNDYYGHPAGDTCLQKVAAAIASTLKRPADLVARYGGEEFVVILPNTQLEGAVQVAEMIQQAIAQLAIPHQTSASSDYITVSMGIANLIPSARLSINHLITAADHALYAAKANGRNQYALSDWESTVLQRFP